MAAFDLIEELREFVDERTRKDTVPFHLQVFASLQFFAHGSYQTIVGEDMNLGMSQPIISRAIKKVSILISTYLLPRYVKFPSSDEDVRKAEKSFVNANLDFPNAIGTLDCTHVAIFSPQTDDPIHPAVAYINRNVQAIFDANLIITNINVQYPGATHDSAIWHVSRIHRHLRRKNVEGRRNCFLLGDSGYPIQPWLMTPFLNTLPNSPEKMYNIMHRRTRNVVERGFGVLKARFRCLRKDRVLHYSHLMASRIICSAVLHKLWKT
ncbi:hypothetical protein JTB14_012688 [Gonioctena quinquepunctata]|nr:hypothetical protein JTB14_012688 [Gonioctena quinquepunctata]